MPRPGTIDLQILTRAKKIPPLAPSTTIESHAAEARHENFFSKDDG
jgi:hypothetical protein